MSKLSLYLCCLALTCASSARLDHLVPQNYAGSKPSNDVPYNYENVNNGDGNYRFSYDTPDGISAHESGSPRAPGPEGPAVTAEGGFSYRAPDGQQISLTYVADENGFQPQGSHLPTPPPIPDAIQKSIEFNRNNPEPGAGAGAGRNGY